MFLSLHLPVAEFIEVSSLPAELFDSVEYFGYWYGFWDS